MPEIRETHRAICKKQDGAMKIEMTCDPYSEHLKLGRHKPLDWVVQVPHRTIEPRFRSCALFKS
jgi:hypothetical protein